MVLTNLEDEVVGEGGGSGDPPTPLTARTGATLERRSRLHARRATRELWALTALMAGGSLLLYLLWVRPLSGFATPYTFPWPALALLFCAVESWRIYFYFGRSAHSLALSEIPMFIGLFLASSPGGMVSARLAGAAVGLGLLRRQPPIKLAFNLSLFTIEALVATILVHLFVPLDQPVAIRAWLVVLATVVVLSVITAAVVLVAISVSEGRPQTRQTVEGVGVSLLGAVANASMALAVVALAYHDVSEMMLLVIPAATMAVAYSAYSRERLKHERTQQLFRSKDLMQTGAEAPTAMGPLLIELCKVFRADVAEMTLLPDSPGHPARVIRVRDGVTIRTEEHLDHHILDEMLLVIMPEVHSVVVTPRRAGKAEQRLLSSRRLKDALIMALQVDGHVLGMLLVGDRQGDLSTFDREDMRLIETLGTQMSVALETWRLDEQLKHQVFHDSLTGLANRDLFTDRLAHALKRRATPDRVRAAALLLDLDDFRLVNDGLGHATGDLVLQAFASRVGGVLRSFDTAARVGGDEFAVLLEDINDAAEAVDVASRIVDALRDPLIVLGQEVAMHASIGVAVAGADEIGPEELLRQADLAMGRAKLRGKATVEVFDLTMQSSSQHDFEVKNDLERALTYNQLVVLYQPIVAVTSGGIVSVEALVRWAHPERGMVPPDEFIPVAEATGMILGIGEHVLRVACEQARAWELAYPGARLGMSVNVSPRQLLHPGFPDVVRRTLIATGLSRELLTLEITETSLVTDSETMMTCLHDLKSIGVSLSIDDFGTGYSSLSALQLLPVDVLKIAKPFIDDVAEDPRKRAFVKTIVSLGTTLGLKLIAEGVERPEQLEQLRRLHCELAQGYIFARPLPAEGVTALLQQYIARGTPFENSLPSRRPSLALPA